MTKARDDDGLRATFQGLRDDTRRSGRAPAFEAMMREARREAEPRPALQVVDGDRSERRLRNRRWLRFGAWASAAVAAAVAGLILVDRGPGGEEDFERLVAAYASQAGGGGWSSPTSGLLDVPGMDFIRSVPSIGAPVRGLDASATGGIPSSSEEENL